MESVISSLGALMLRALPTFFILLFLHYYLKIMFFKPLERVLAERKAATAGLKKLADESIRNAERKAAQYEEAIRAARGTLYKEQEERRSVWRREQAAALASMREQADSLVLEAKKRLSSEKDSAQSSLRGESEALAEQIARAALAGRSN